MCSHICGSEGHYGDCRHYQEIKRRYYTYLGYRLNFTQDDALLSWNKAVREYVVKHKIWKPWLQQPGEDFL